MNLWSEAGKWRTQKASPETLSLSSGVSAGPSHKLPDAWLSLLGFTGFEFCKGCKLQRVSVNSVSRAAWSGIAARRVVWVVFFCVVRDSDRSRRRTGS